MMGQKKRIAHLEAAIIVLQERVAALEAKPAYVPFTWTDVNPYPPYISSTTGKAFYP